MAFWSLTQQPAKTPLPTAGGSFWSGITEPTGNATKPLIGPVGLPSMTVSQSTPAVATGPAPINEFLKAAGQGFARSTAASGAGISALPEQARAFVTNTPVKPGTGEFKPVGKVQEAIYGTDKPISIKSMGEEYGAKPVAEGGSGFNPSLIGLAGAFLDLSTGGGIKGLSGLTKALQTAEKVEHVVPLMKNAGFADDIITQYAPVFAKEKDLLKIEQGLLSAEKLQNSTKAVEGVRGLPEKPATKPFFDLTTPPAKVVDTAAPRAALPEAARAVPEAPAVARETPVFATPDEVKLDPARFSWTTFNPERKVAQYQTDFVDRVNTMYEKLAKEAKSDAQKAILEAEIKRYKEGLLTRTLDLANADSKVASPMVTGPARFNFAKRDALLKRYMSKVDELTEYEANAERAIRRRLSDQVVADAGGEVAFNAKKLQDMKDLQASMKEANKIIRMQISDEQKLQRMLQLKGFNPKVAEAALKPDFMGRKGFSSYSLTNLNAKIKTLEAKIGRSAKLEQLAETVGTRVEQSATGELVQNFEADRVQIKFPGKPTPEMIALLKSKGFHWSPFNKVWQRKLTPRAVQVAREILGIEVKKAPTIAAEVAQVADTPKNIFHATSPENVDSMRKMGIRGDLDRMYFASNEIVGKNYGKGVVSVPESDFKLLDARSPEAAKYNFDPDFPQLNAERIAKLKEDGYDGIKYKTGKDNFDYEIFNKEKLNAAIKEKSTEPITAARTTPPDAETAKKIYYDEVIKPALDNGDPVVIGGDDLKHFFGKDYDDANHPIYSKAAYALYEDALKESRSGQVAFTGGGPGSGKSELVVNHLKDEGYKGIIYDSNFSNFDGAKKQIEAARAAGKTVRIYGIIPNLEKSRGFTVMREAGGGRSITDKTFAHGHTGFPDTIRRLLEEGVVTKDEVRLFDTRAIDGLENAKAHMKAGAYAHDPLALVKRLAYNKDEINKLYGKANYTDQGAYTGANRRELQQPEVRAETRVTPDANRANQEVNPEDLPTVQIGDGGVRQVTAPKAFEKLPNTPKTEIDRLIADGKVRVQYIDGRDVYQIKKGSEWRNVRDESSAIKQVTAPPRPRAGLPKPAIPEAVQNEIDQLEASIAFKEEALDSMVGKQFMKYVSRTTGELPEVTGTEFIDSLTGKRDRFGKPIKVKNSEYGRRGDQIAENIFGYSDSYNLQKGHQEAQAAVDKYKKAKVDLEEDKLKLSELKRTARTASADEQVLIAMAERGDKELIALRESAKPEPKVKISTPPQDSISKGEVRSLERLARESLNSINPVDAAVVKPLRSIVEATSTTVKDKIHLIDYLRTPERVLRKIGFSNEARLLRDQYDKYLAELPKNIDKITAWSKRVSGPEANKDIFRWLDGEAITLKEQDQKVADEISAWLAEWADRLDLPKDKRITNYITHIFDKDLITKEFDEDLAKIISDKIPGSVYDPFLEKRLGKLGYRQDTWAALDAYVKRGTRKVHVDPILEQIRGRAGKTLEESPLEESQFKYIQRYINTINMRPTEFDNLVDNFIKSTPVGYRLGQRPLTYSLKVLRQVAYRAMLGLNPGSALRNLSQGVNTYATLGEKYTAIGYASLFKRGAFQELKDVGVLNHGFIEDRVLNAHKKVLQTADKVLFSFFEGAERVNRGAAYFGAKAKAIAAGESEEDAIKFAREIVRKTQFAFGSVDTPVGLSSDVVKSILQFQNFSVKQTEFLATLAKEKDYAAMLRYAAAGVAFVYTAGQAIGMSPTELIPFYNQLTGQSGGAFGTPPSLKVPIEIVKGVVDAPDKYGNKLTVTEKAANVGKAFLTGIVPGGTQIKKTYEGIKAVQEGGVFDKGGNLQFQQGTSLPARAQSIVFGKYAGPESKAYFESKKAREVDYSSIAPIYDEVQKLKEADRVDDAQAIVDSLSEEDYALYKGYKTQVTTQKTLEAKKAILPTYQKVQDLKKAGKIPEAQAIVDGMTDEEYRAYELVKKQVERDEKATSGVKPTYEDGEPQTARSIINTVLTYAQAVGTDPVTAFARIFKGEVIRRVDNGAIIVERMSLDESQAVKESQGGNNPTVKLDHTIPLQLGGSNDESNLKLVPTEVWETYTPVENALGEALRSGRISKTEAQRLIRALKDGSMSAEQVTSQIP